MAEPELSSSGSSFELPNMSAVRLQLADVFCFWSFSLAVLIIFTSSWRLSVVVATFFAANFFLLFYWYAGEPADPVAFTSFLEGLRVGGHRGLADDAPENTLSAIRMTKEMGADSVEFDLEYTSDGVAILLHDDSVDRTTDGHGNIAEMTFKQTQEFNAAAKFSIREKFPVEKIPTLEEAIALSLELNLRIFIDVKVPHPLVTKTITKLFKKYEELYRRAAVCSFWPQVVYEVKRADHRIITGHTWRPGFFTFSDISMKSPRYEGSLVRHISLLLLDEIYVWLLHSWMWKFTGASLVLTQERCISAEYVKRWKARGLQVVAWTVNSFPQRLYYLQDLKLPFLTDRLSDFRASSTHTQYYRDSRQSSSSEDGGTCSNSQC